MEQFIYETGNNILRLRESGRYNFMKKMELEKIIMESLQGGV